MGYVQFYQKYKNVTEFVKFFINKLPCIKTCYKSKFYNQHLHGKHKPGEVSLSSVFFDNEFNLAEVGEIPRKLSSSRSEHHSHHQQRGDHQALDNKQLEFQERGEGVLLDIEDYDRMNDSCPLNNNESSLPLMISHFSGDEDKFIDELMKFQQDIDGQSIGELQPRPTQRGVSIGYEPHEENECNHDNHVEQ
jgi:hypothetical protein